MTVQGAISEHRLHRLAQHLKPSQNQPRLVLSRTSTPLTAHKVITAEEAALLVKDGSTITVGGFVGSGSPEALLAAIRTRFENEQHPRALNLVWGISVGDKQGKGLENLAREDLLASLTFAWTGTCPAFLKLVKENKVQAWNLPLGAISHLYRDIAAGKPGPIMKIGMGTFADPGSKGGKLNAITTTDKVEAVRLGGQSYLWYKAFPIQVALLRGTVADVYGNITVEKESLLCDQLAQAMAVKNSGGLVIVQVEHLATEVGCRSVHIPGVMVDHVVLAPPDKHPQTLGAPSPEHDPSLTGQLKLPLGSMRELPMDPKRIMAHRAMFELNKDHMLVNLGVGTPEKVATMAVTHGDQVPTAGTAILSTEAGSVGGSPLGGAFFGASRNPQAHLPTCSMLDYYQGGAIDVTCLGAAEVDASGNVNVSNFGAGRTVGCGGFVDISQSAKKVVFMGTLTSGGLKVAVSNGKLEVTSEGKIKKFVKSVNERTFAASSNGTRPVLYITERAVFSLTPQGLELKEVAPGVDIEKDVIAQMEFRPMIPSTGVKCMDPRIFQP